MLGFIAGRNWNSLGLTALNETGTDGVMLKARWTEADFISWLKWRSRWAVRESNWSPLLTLALTSRGVVMMRITMTTATARMAIGSSHQLRRRVCVWVHD